MKIQCSECGCWVDRGVVVDHCPQSDCCCQDLPDQSPESPAQSGAPEPRRP